MNQHPTLNETKWDYLELDEIYFKKPECQIPNYKMRGNSTGAPNIDGLGPDAQSRFKDKREFLHNLIECVNYDPKFNSGIRNQYQRLIQIGYQPEWLSKIESHKIPRQWEKENFEAHQCQKRRCCEANSKVENYLADQKNVNSWNENEIKEPEQEARNVEAPKIDKQRRSISITIQSIENTDPSEDDHQKSPLEKELSEYGTQPQIKKAITSCSVRNGSNSTLGIADILIDENDMRPRIHSTSHQKGKVNLISAGRNSIFSDVNSLVHVDTGRRTSARINQLQTKVKGEVRSIKQNKSKRVGLPPRPFDSKVGIDFETIDEDGTRSRRQLFVSCQDQMVREQMNKQSKSPPSINDRYSQLSMSRLCDASTKQSSRSRVSSTRNDNPSILSIQSKNWNMIEAQCFERNVKNFQRTMHTIQKE